MHDPVTNSETSFFLKCFNFENCFAKLIMTVFVESCFYYFLFLTFILSLVCNKNKQPFIAFCEKCVLENNRYARPTGKFVVKILENYIWRS